MKAFAEISESGDRIDVHFPYDPEAVLAVKQVPGARFVPKDKGGPLWRLPLDLTSARMLREQFGDGLELGNALKAWGRSEVRKERNLTTLAHADDADLTVLPAKLPELAAFYRPYQRADVRFLAEGSSINANQPGLGKTVEVIGAVFEAERDNGPQLVVAPKTSLSVVWEYELRRWQPHPVLVTSGDDSPAKRQQVIAQAKEMADAGEAFWLVLNPHMVRYTRDRTAEMVMERGKRVHPAVPVHPELFVIAWKTKIVDEYHKMGLSNPNTLFTKAMRDVTAEETILMSGTPMGGKPIKLWSGLNIINPGSFTSKWRWADQWLNVEDNGYGKVILGIRKGLEEDFYKTHAPYLLRRTKEEVLTELPPKQYVEIWAEMTPKQRKQYETFAANAEIKIEQENLSATGILAEYTRLRQFAVARQQVANINGKLEVAPTTDSGKLPHLLRLLEERGITADVDEREGDEQVVVFSQFSQVVDMICDYLTGQGIDCARLTGATPQKRRTEIVEQFQAEGGPRVIVMTTTAGGVSITLDKASTVVFMDETWDPDDQEQGEDRVHRASRIHQVTVYYIRSKGTIEEYVQDITEGKALTNEQILDLHRKMMAAMREEVNA